MRFRHFFFINILLLASCKAPVVNNQVHHSATAVPELLSIGRQQVAVFEKPFQVLGIPKLNQRIRLDIKELPYNQTSYKAYNYNQKRQNQEVQFMLNDSLKPTPSYMQLSVLDRINLTEAINTQDNKVLKDYIQDDNDLILVTSILFNAEEEITKQLQDAEEVYAIQDGESNIGLELIRDGGKFAKINLSNIAPFSYAVSNFCWGLDKRNRPELKAIINGSDCPPNTKAKAYKLESPYNYKF